jgi:hypothetical protein
VRHGSIVWRGVARAVNLTGASLVALSSLLLSRESPDHQRCAPLQLLEQLRGRYQQHALAYGAPLERARKATPREQGKTRIRRGPVPAHTWY